MFRILGLRAQIRLWGLSFDKDLGVSLKLWRGAALTWSSGFVKLGREPPEHPPAQLTP